MHVTQDMPGLSTLLPPGGFTRQGAIVQSIRPAAGWYDVLLNSGSYSWSSSSNMNDPEIKARSVLASPTFAEWS